jgi:hypothetical protein
MAEQQLLWQATVIEQLLRNLAVSQDDTQAKNPDSDLE